MIDPALLLVLTLAQDAPFQRTFDQGGFIENQSLFYPRTAVYDAGHVVSDIVLRWEASYKIAPWIKITGALNASTDSHRQVEREARFDAGDRSLQRPAFSLRLLNATLHKGHFTADVGKQFIRWGRTDILTPTDRFAPKDYLSDVIHPDLVGVSAARVTWEAGSNTVEWVWQPLFTPNRTPLFNQRWTVLPEQIASTPVSDLGARYPGGSQYGFRWNHTGAGYDYALSFFDGFNSLPLLDVRLQPPGFTLQRYYPSLRLYGEDLAVPLPWFTIKQEAAYFTSSTPHTDEYVLYVVQGERQVKEWSFVGGYAGEWVTRSTGNPLSFAPDRGIAPSFIGRAALTIDVNRSLALEVAARAAGSFVRFEYSQAFGQHWRATTGWAWIRGDMTDFLGQYRRNSYASLALRYSF